MSRACGACASLPSSREGGNARSRRGNEDVLRTRGRALTSRSASTRSRASPVLAESEGEESGEREGGGLALTRAAEIGPERARATRREVGSRARHPRERESARGARAGGGVGDVPGRARGRRQASPPSARCCAGRAAGALHLVRRAARVDAPARRVAPLRAADGREPAAPPPPPPPSPSERRAPPPRDPHAKNSASPYDPPPRPPPRGPRRRPLSARGAAARACGADGSAWFGPVRPAGRARRGRPEPGTAAARERGRRGASSGAGGADARGGIDMTSARGSASAEATARTELKL